MNGDGPDPLDEFDDDGQGDDSAGGDSAGTAGPQHDETPQGVQVEVRRSGGFAGITRTGTVDLSHLPPAASQQWQSLLASVSKPAGDGAQPAARSGRRIPDGFVYQVRCPALGIETTFTQASTSPDERRLLDNALD